MQNLETLINNVRIAVLLDSDFWDRYLSLTDKEIFDFVDNKAIEYFGKQMPKEFIIGLLTAMHFDSYRSEVFTNFILTNNISNLIETRNNLIGIGIFDQGMYDSLGKFNLICEEVDRQYWDEPIFFKNLLICDFIKEPTYFLTNDFIVEIAEDDIRFVDDRQNQIYQTFHQLLLDEYDLGPLETNIEDYESIVGNAIQMNDYQGLATEEFIEACINRLRKEIEWMEYYSNDETYIIDEDYDNGLPGKNGDRLEYTINYYYDKFGVNMFGAETLSMLTGE